MAGLFYFLIAVYSYSLLLASHAVNDGSRRLAGHSGGRPTTDFSTESLARRPSIRHDDGRQLNQKVRTRNLSTATFQQTKASSRVIQYHVESKSTDAGRGRLVDLVSFFSRGVCSLISLSMTGRTSTTSRALIYFWIYDKMEQITSSRGEESCSHNICHTSRCLWLLVATILSSCAETTTKTTKTTWHQVIESSNQLLAAICCQTGNSST